MAGKWPKKWPKYDRKNGPKKRDEAPIFIVHTAYFARKIDENWYLLREKNETKMALSKRKYARANLLGRCVAEQRKC
jgi:hypothetical protein